MTMRLPVTWTEPPQPAAGPPVLLVHGVGVGPTAFGPVADRLAGAGHRVGVVHRPGYGLAAGHLLTPLDTQVAALSRLVDTLATAVLAGVSGGATLALLAAVARARAGSRAGVTVVCHEPLVGPLAPDLHRRVTRAAGELGLGSQRFVRRLVGEATWSTLDDDTRATTVRRPDLVAAEARAFARVAPTPGDLAAVRLAGGLVTTVGERSGPERHRAAAALARLSGSRVEVVAGSGHLAQVDAPDAFAATILAAAPAPAEALS